jgi:hypothetical protein
MHYVGFVMARLNFNEPRIFNVKAIKLVGSALVPEEILKIFLYQ